MAMIAGAAGIGMIGAWPQIKIVSVRATNAPTPGQEPTFEFNDYTEGHERVLQRAGDQTSQRGRPGVVLQIPPSPDQAQGFANDVAEAQAQNIAVVAAAGN